MQRVCDLPHWPPDAAGTIPPSGGVFAVLAEQVNIKEVVRAVGNSIDFTGKSGQMVVRYCFKAPDAKTARKLTEILKRNVNMPLFSIGALEIPPDVR